MPSVGRGRPRRFAEYDSFYRSLSFPMKKRPQYLKGLGVFRGQRGDTAWVKISLPQGATYQGRSYRPGSSLEIKVGNLSSWTWEQLTQKHNELQGRADRGESLEPEELVLFSEYAKEWLSRAQRRVKAYETLEIHVRKHLTPYFGSKGIAEINASDINKWVTQQSKVLAAGTVKRQFNTLRAILISAVKSGLLDKDPTQNADRLRGGRARQRFLEISEIKKLIGSCEKIDGWLADFVLWAIHSGMRKSEITRMRWMDVQSISDKVTIVTIPDTKSDQPRVVQSTATMLEILQRQKERTGEENELVFTATSMTLRRKWEAARNDAGLSDVTLHDLRRTHTTHAVAAGVDLRTMADRLGHSDLSMMQKHYSQIMKSQTKVTTDRIEEALAI